MQTRVSTFITISCLAVLATGCGSSARSEAAPISGENASADTTLGTWAVVPTPGIGHISDPAELFAAAATSAVDAWAFGQEPTASTGGGFIPLVEHYDGSTWTTYGTPTLKGATDSTFTAGAAVTTSSAWAVGYATSASIPFGQTLIERWDGSSWKLSSHPGTGSFGSRLSAVSADALNDVWAVGEEFLSAGAESETLVMHFNGTSWAASSPYRGTSFSRLYAVKAFDPTDVWALGSDFNSPLALHYDGKAWTSFPFPIQTNPPVDSTFPASIDGASGSDVWVLGYNDQPAGYEGGEAPWAQAWHWDGTAWTIVSIPGEINSEGSFYSGVAALASNDVWALGMGGGFYAGQQVTLHYDGTGWTQVSNPANGNYFPGMSALARSPAGDVWAVGTTDATFSTFAMHYVP